MARILPVVNRGVSPRSTSEALADRHRDLDGNRALLVQVAELVDEARAAAEQMGYPVAIKVISEQNSHKSDVGGVQLNLRNAPAVEEAFEDMLRRIHQFYPDAKIDGVLVQPMVTGGQELILGGRQDPNFGPVVLIGLGGVFVEVFEEVALRVAPITHKEAEEMIEELPDL